MNYRLFKKIFIPPFVLLVLATWYFELPLLNIIIWLGIYVGALAWGSMHIQSNFFLNSINSHDKKGLVLTFDDGPHPQHTPEVLDVLAAHGVKATFFCVGERMRRYPEIARRIHDEGHILGNHTYRHTYFWGFLDRSQVDKEIKLTQVLIHDITGIYNAYFRPPFGVTNPHIAKSIQHAGLKCIGWDIRSLDTVEKDPDITIDRIRKKLEGGSILLMHDNLPNTANILNAVLKDCRDFGKPIVTLEEVDSNKHLSFNE